MYQALVEVGAARVLAALAYRARHPVVVVVSGTKALHQVAAVVDFPDWEEVAAVEGLDRAQLVHGVGAYAVALAAGRVPWMAEQGVVGFAVAVACHALLDMQKVDA
jgi:hypothetical protein